MNDEHILDLRALLVAERAAHARTAAQAEKAIEDVRALRHRAERAEERLREVAALFGVRDGAQYLNDAKERARVLGLADSEAGK